MKTKTDYFNEIKLLPNRMVVYHLIDPNTSRIRYVGKAEILIDRIKNHYKPCRLKDQTHKNNWLKSILIQNKLPIVEVIEECENIDTLNQAEIKWIAHYRSLGYDLTNSTDGGTGGKLSPESIAKMSASKKGKNLSEEHKKNISLGLVGQVSGMKGKNHSESAKQKIGAASKNRIVSDETKSKISKIHKGKVISEEAKHNMSIAHMGHTVSPENKEKLSKRMMGNQYGVGRTVSPETRQKMSEARVGRIVSEETIEKLSIAHSSEESVKIKSERFKGKIWELIDGKRVWMDKL
jgi:hypothetical protein